MQVFVELFINAQQTTDLSNFRLSPAGKIDEPRGKSKLTFFEATVDFIYSFAEILSAWIRRVQTETWRYLFRPDISTIVQICSGGSSG